VGYLPAPSSIGELKSKPIQQSIIALNSLGVLPDFVIGRAARDIDMKRKEKIAYASGLPIENIISNPDVDSVYFVPLTLDEEKIAPKILKRLKIKHRKKDLTEWKALVRKVNNAVKPVKIGIVGKYQKTGDYILSDSYVSVVEALNHAGFYLGAKAQVSWIDSQSLEGIDERKIESLLSEFDGIIVPQGWGSRGIEGKIKAIEYARENKVPYLGLCFGMQMATIEFARHVLNFETANTTEANPKTSCPVIHVMDNQKEYLLKKNYGGTIRLGAWPCKVMAGTKLYDAYKKYGMGKASPWWIPNPRLHQQSTASHQMVIHERHRHRYEFNNKFKKDFEKNGFVISGTSPDGHLVEAIELKDHPFFVGTQFHPEYISRPLTPHPVFISFLEACLE